MTTPTMSTASSGFLLKQEKHREKHIWGNDDIYKMIQKRGQKGVLAGRSGQSQWSNKVYESNASAAHSENGAFGTSRTGSHALSTVSGVRLNFPFRIGGDVEAYAKAKEWRYMLAALEEGTEECFSAIEFFCSTYWYQNGDNVLGTVNGTPAGTTNGTFVMDEAFNVNHIRKGMFLTARVGATGATEQFSAGVCRVVDVDRTTNTITGLDISDLADNDTIMRDGHAGQSAPNGLRNMFSATATINNIDRTTAGNNYYKTFLIDRSGSPLTEANTRTMGNHIRYFSNKDDSDVNLVILMHPDNAQVLWNTVGDNWRFSDKGTAEIGFGDVKIHTPYGTVVVIHSPMCHKQDIYFINPKDFIFYAPPGDGGGFMSAGHWYETGGQIIHPVRSSDSLTDSKEMVRVLRYQTTARRFDRSGRITDFT